jgi:hypothetical protein
VGWPTDFLSEIRVVANLFSNVFAIAVVARWLGELDDERLPVVLDGDRPPISNLSTSSRRPVGNR